ncbi:hypothetical protein M2103_002075 [Ereboglobus sp. PH5-5]|uniref:hypothetical protein n=1 Tax=unclassified Ereboglobus TaxID=2626932 RepID=UPI002405CA10|nr:MULTISPECIES: hypothetical protein [unclassified Ereboglobus]MDF9826254.1 hypothetical protein [Ereboglobus sp. PH5-10]MDF9833842.1 hypothetical protein [Ereboglobus sp. PH5-5]
MKLGSRALLFLLVFALAQPHGHAANEDIVTLDTLTVSTPRHEWRYMRSPHFEILSAVDNSKLITRIMQRAEQIISVFEQSNTLFRMRRELPAKIIFINDQGVERYLVLAGKDGLQYARDNPPPGVYLGREASDVRPILVSGFYDSEQAVFLKFMPQAYLDNETPFDERVTENAIDLALNYLLMCVEIQAGCGSVLWLSTALNSLRGHQQSTPPPPLGSPGFGSPIYRCKYRPAWFSIDDYEMSFGRYCVMCETALLSRAPDFPQGTSRDAIVNRRKIWRDFALAPNASLGEFLEPKPRKTRRVQRTVASRNASIIVAREARDFVYYCTFAADDKIREAFARFVVNTNKQRTNESVFKEYFGMDYDTFRARMYDFFGQLGKNDPEFKDNPWGPCAIVVAKFTRNDIPSLKFRPARRSETTRIVSDWFALCGARDMARQVLLKTNDESVHARNDPEFIAALGLSEAAHGRKYSAAAMLEKAMASQKVVRPTAWRMLSRLRLENLLALKGEKHRLTKDELDTVIEPLVEALKQGVESQQTYVQFAQAWAHTDVKLPREYIDLLAARVRAWPENAELRDAVGKIR